MRGIRQSNTWQPAYSKSIILTTSYQTHKHLHTVTKEVDFTRCVKVFVCLCVIVALLILGLIVGCPIKLANYIISALERETFFFLVFKGLDKE